MYSTYTFICTYIYRWAKLTHKEKMTALNNETRRKKRFVRHISIFIHDWQADFCMHITYIHYIHMLTHVYRDERFMCPSYTNTHTHTRLHDDFNEISFYFIHIYFKWRFPFVKKKISKMLEGILIKMSFIHLCSVRYDLAIYQSDYKRLNVIYCTEEINIFVDICMHACAYSGLKS